MIFKKNARVQETKTHIVSTFNASLYSLPRPCGIYLQFLSMPTCYLDKIPITPLRPTPPSPTLNQDVFHHRKQLFGESISNTQLSFTHQRPNRYAIHKIMHYIHQEQFKFLHFRHLKSKVKYDHASKKCNVLQCKNLSTFEVKM